MTESELLIELLVGRAGDGLERVRGSPSRVSEQIDDGVQEDPHHVHKVPVQTGHLEAEMLLRRVVTTAGPQQPDREQCRPYEHVQAVKPGEGEEGGREGAV